jgi:small GTP-binding protein
MSVSRKANVALIGEPHVGKTTIANRLVNDPVLDDYYPTIGASMVKIPYQASDGPTWFYLWDTAGMEKYRSLAPVFYRDSHAAIIVYDVSDRATFEKLEMWRALYQENVGAANPILIVGNKTDLAGRIAVPPEEGELWAEGHQCQFATVSAKAGTNLDALVPKVAAMLRSAEVASAERAVPQPADPAQAGCC